MKKKNRNLFILLLVIAIGFQACKTKKKDNTITNLLLLSALAGSSTSGPKYEFSETTASVNAFISDYFGTGVDGYTIPDVTFSAAGPSNPTVIVQVEQEQTTGGNGIDFVQYEGTNSSSLFYTRNSVGGKTATALHWYGSDTSLYTSLLSNSNPVTISPSLNAGVGFIPIVISSSLPITVRKVRSLIAATAEESNFTPDSTTTDHSQRGMSKVWSTEKKINIHLIFVSGSNPSASETGIATAISRLTTLYTQDSVRVRPVITSTTLSDTAYLNLNSLDGDSLASGSLGGLFANNASVEKADALNIFFVKSETVVGGVLGVSGGLPGLPGKTGTRNSGMVVMFDSHLGTPGATPTDSELTLMGETIAHEAGHWLGLFHLVESNYATNQTTYYRDPISETPLCTQNPLNLANCNSTGLNNSGARNVMFYTGTTGFDQPRLTGEQGWILRRHPLVY